jgi:5-(carboxyamino)imidazole ribonucleotide synthase
MFNFIGNVPPLADVLKHTDAHIHHYGKGPRPGRKVGHVTLRTGREEEMRAKLPEWNSAFERGS